MVSGNFGMLQVVVKSVFKPVVGLANTGSFDFVRLSPHFAQDDRLGDGC